MTKEQLIKRLSDELSRARFGIDKGTTVDDIEVLRHRVLVGYGNDWHTFESFIKTISEENE
jgi:hypothetical protein